jgi:hypothetical protein
VRSIIAEIEKRESNSAKNTETVHDVVPDLAGTGANPLLGADEPRLSIKTWEPPESMT